MRRKLLCHVTSACKARSLGGLRYASRGHELLEKALNLKQAEGLPRQGRAVVWNDRPLRTWEKVARAGFYLFALGAVIYEADRYRKLGPHARRILDVNDFLAFTLSSKEPVSSTCSIFTLRPNNNKSIADPYEMMWMSPAWSVQAKQPQLQIARSYTPLPPTRPYAASDPDACSLRLMIREEDKGEMSSYLHRLGDGATVELRGPFLEGQVPSNVDEIIFFAGGTGIAPALQVAHYLSTIPPGSRKVPRMQIVWSSRHREDCRGGIDDTPKPAPRSSGWPTLLGSFKPGKPATGQPPVSPIVQELERVKALYHGRVKVDYYVDEEKSFVDDTAVRRYLAANNADEEPSMRKAVMVSGPEGFINHLAGPKIWKDGKEQQGILGGLLKEATVPSHWTVIKV